MTAETVPREGNLFNPAGVGNPFRDLTVDAISSNDCPLQVGEVGEESPERGHQRWVINENKLLQSGRKRRRRIPGKGDSEGSGEALVEEELAQVLKGGEEKWVNSGRRRTGRIPGVIGEETEAHLDDMGGVGVRKGKGSVGRVEKVVANEAVRGGGAEVAGEKGPPGDGGVDGVKNLENRVSLERREKR